MALKKLKKKSKDGKRVAAAPAVALKALKISKKEAAAAATKPVSSKRSSEQLVKTAEHRMRKKKNPLFELRRKRFGIDRDLRHHVPLTRYVRWPKYIRLQRQKAILYQRCKIPPPINQFRLTLDNQTAGELLRFLHKYRPEKKSAKYKRLKARALRKLKTKVDKPTRRKPVLRQGVNTVTALIEKKKAQLVVIASDVNPIELVVFMPALCRKMGVAYCIMHSKSRLGRLVGRKTCAVVAIVNVKPQHNGALSSVIRAIRTKYMKRFEEVRRKWGGCRVSMKTQLRLVKIKQNREKEQAMRRLHM